MKKLRYLLLTFTVLILFGVNIKAQGKWYYYSSIQVVPNSQQSNSFLIYNGIRYQTQDLYLSLSVPVILNHNNSSDSNDGNYSDGMMNGNSMGLFGNMELSDIYINGSYKLLAETESLPSISLEGYVKLPTAPKTLFVGSGSTDFQMAAGFRKVLGNFFLYGQIGYLYFGTHDENILNPLTISTGIGYAFNGGKHSVMFGYDSYSTVIQGTNSPEQIAVGYNYMLASGFFINLITSKGLNNSTSDYSFSGGISVEL